MELHRCIYSPELADWPDGEIRAVVVGKTLRVMEQVWR
jgi:hypothetical protein